MILWTLGVNTAEVKLSPVLAKRETLKPTNLCFSARVMELGSYGFFVSLPAEWFRKDNQLHRFYREKIIIKNINAIVKYTIDKNKCLFIYHSY